MSLPLLVDEYRDGLEILCHLVVNDHPCTDVYLFSVEDSFLQRYKVLIFHTKEFQSLVNYFVYIGNFKQLKCELFSQQDHILYLE